MALVALVSLAGLASARRASGANLTASAAVETEARRTAFRTFIGGAQADVVVEVQRIRSREVELIGLATGVATASADRVQSATVSGVATLVATAKGEKTNRAGLESTVTVVVNAHSRVRRRANGNPAVLLGI